MWEWEMDVVLGVLKLIMLMNVLLGFIFNGIFLGDLVFWVI